MNTRKKICGFIFLISFILSFSFVEGITYNTSIVQWNVNTEIDDENERILVSPDIMDITHNAQFNFIANASTFRSFYNEKMNFSVLGENSFWNKTNFDDRINTFCLHGYENESSSFSIAPTVNSITSFHIYFLENSMHGNGTLFEYSFNATEYGIEIEDIILSYQTWYKIEIQYATQKMRIIEYENRNWKSVYELPISSSNIFYFDFLSRENGKLYYIDAFQYNGYGVSFDYSAINAWNLNYLGENTTNIVMNCDIEFPNTRRKYDSITNQYNASVILISYKNPFNVSLGAYSFYIAKVFAPIPYYLYSQQWNNWIEVENASIQIEFTKIKGLESMHIGNYTQTSNTYFEGILRNYEVFSIQYEGYTNETFTIHFDAFGNGHLPEVIYDIQYDNQKSVNTKAYISIYAKNVSENISGVYNPNGTIQMKIRNEYLRFEVSNEFGISEKTYVVALYNLNYELVVRKVITLKVMYFERDTNNYKSLAEYWYWMIIIGFACILIAFIKKKKSNTILVKNPSQIIEREVDTFYPNIGIIPKGCEVKKGKLICPNIKDNIIF